MKALLTDLANEQAALDCLVADIRDDQWSVMTPFSEWTVQDQVSHLAFFDGAAFLAMTDPQAFQAQSATFPADETVFDVTLDKGRRMAPADLLAWWRRERDSLLGALGSREAKDRIEWFGPPMSVRTLATARLMETWAHGQNIVDALDLKRPATARLRHIAQLGYITFGWSFFNRRLDPPDKLIRLELLAPGGDTWAWGPDAADETVRGPAEDFCLVVTQRRHPYDTGLEWSGPATEQWLLYAQAFAGPPTFGPRPGRFPRTRE
ncbi:MAG: TIGR03084 family protein [Syntrophaceae bacterium]|nr:TIGR03084 family protein [Syntrophaceae bacterium]